VFKVAGLTELDAESRFLRHCHFLTIFVHRKGADDHLLGVLGENCPVLQEVNVTGSSKVTDQGVINLLGTLQNENPCASSLRFAKMKATKVRVNGVRHLLNIAKNLQGIRCSNFDVLQALATKLKALQNGCEESLNLRYLDFSNCFSILSKYMNWLIHLTEIRIGSDAPPQMRLTTRRLLIDDHLNDDATVIAALEELPKLEDLQTLVLKAFDLKYQKCLLSTQVGIRLRRLDLHFNYEAPGVNLAEIAILCPYLTDLAVCDSLVKCDEHLLVHFRH